MSGVKSAHDLDIRGLGVRDGFFLTPNFDVENLRERKVVASFFVFSLGNHSFTSAMIATIKRQAASLPGARVKVKPRKNHCWLYLSPASMDQPGLGESCIKMTLRIYLMLYRAYMRHQLAEAMTAVGKKPSRARRRM